MRCRVTHKSVFASQHIAEIAADEMARANWQRGLDTRVSVYCCVHCGELHIGRSASRPRVDWLVPLHIYKHLPNPNPYRKPTFRYGNFY